MEQKNILNTTSFRYFVFQVFHEFEADFFNSSAEASTLDSDWRGNGIFVEAVATWPPTEARAFGKQCGHIDRQIWVRKLRQFVWHARGLQVNLPFHVYVS